MHKQPQRYQRGQALVVLLVFVTVAMAVTIVASLLTTYTITQSSLSEQTTLAQQMAESAMENALLRLLRDPSYTGESSAYPEGVATTTVSGTSTKTITSQARVGSTIRTISVTANYANGVLQIATWNDAW